MITLAVTGAPDSHRGPVFMVGPNDLRARDCPDVFFFIVFRTDFVTSVRFASVGVLVSRAFGPRGPVNPQGVDITIPVTCSVFEPDPMTSQCTRGVPRLKFRHKIHEMWVIFSSVAIASQ